MKYASPVAFIHDDQIRFGIVKEIIRREGAKGKTTEYLVESLSFGPNKVAWCCIAAEEHIAEIEPAYPSLIGDRVAQLFFCMSSYAWALDTSRDLLHPPASEADRAAVITAVAALSAPEDEGTF